MQKTVESSKMDNEQLEMREVRGRNQQTDNGRFKMRESGGNLKNG